MQHHLEIAFCHVPCKRRLLRELPLPSALLRRQASSSRSASSRASPRQTSPLPPHLPLLPSCAGAAWQRRSCAGGAGRMRTQTRRLPPRASSRRRTRCVATACACCGDAVETTTSPAHVLLPSPPALPRPLKPCGPARHRREHARRRPDGHGARRPTIPRPPRQQPAVQPAPQHPQEHASLVLEAPEHRARRRPPLPRLAASSRSIQARPRAGQQVPPTPSMHCTNTPFPPKTSLETWEGSIPRRPHLSAEADRNRETW